MAASTMFASELEAEKLRASSQINKSKRLPKAAIARGPNETDGTLICGRTRDAGIATELALAALGGLDWRQLSRHSSNDAG